MVSKAQPRGIRNNNPGNIKKTGDNWVGLAEQQKDPIFFTFKSPVFGIRALTKIILHYMNDLGLNTVNEIIGRYAPPSENSTDNYSDFVSEKIGVDKNTPLDWWDIPKLIDAIIIYENGYNPYTEIVLADGFDLAMASS